MKKLGLFLVFALGLVLSNAQITLLYYSETEGTQTPFTDSLHVLLTNTQTPSQEYTYVRFKNNTDANIDVKVRLDNSEVARGNRAMMCFGGNCLDVTESGVVTLEANSIYEGFDILYRYTSLEASMVGISLIDPTTDNEIVGFVVDYHSPNAIPTIQDKEDVKLSAVVSPNPANTNALFRYSVPSNYNGAKLVVRNTLGSVVKIYTLKTGVNGKVVMPLTDLNSGIYFYSIVADGATLLTKKLVVRH